MSKPGIPRTEVSISFVDGAYMDLDVDHEFLGKLLELEARGVSGKELIEALVGDYGGAPPRQLDAKGMAPDGQIVNRRIMYE